jgi:hypothetical protein
MAQRLQYVSRILPIRENACLKVRARVTRSVKMVGSYLLMAECQSLIKSYQTADFQMLDHDIRLAEQQARLRASAAGRLQRRSTVLLTPSVSPSQPVE